MLYSTHYYLSNNYTFSGEALWRLKSKSNQIKVSVSVNGADSDLRELKHWVPEGSVLGPLLFLIYINDLNTCISNSKVYHFADDTNLLHINSCINKLQ